MKTYLIYDGRYYKIGQSTNPLERLKNLRTANPAVKLIAFGEGSTESIFHNRYKNKRINGEWFKLSNNDVNNIIRSLRNEYEGIDEFRIKRIEKQKIFEDKQFEKNSKYQIKFGKYKNQMITDMNSIDELKYLKWCIKNFKNKKSKTVKIFKWWLKQHNIA